MTKMKTNLTIEQLNKDVVVYSSLYLESGKDDDFEAFRDLMLQFLHTFTVKEINNDNIYSKNETNQTWK